MIAGLSNYVQYNYFIGVHVGAVERQWALGHGIKLRESISFRFVTASATLSHHFSKYIVDYAGVYINKFDDILKCNKMFYLLFYESIGMSARNIC